MDLHNTKQRTGGNIENDTGKNIRSDKEEKNKRNDTKNNSNSIYIIKGIKCRERLKSVDLECRTAGVWVLPHANECRLVHWHIHRIPHVRHILYRVDMHLTYIRGAAGGKKKVPGFLSLSLFLTSPQDFFGIFIHLTR